MKSDQPQTSYRKAVIYCRVSSRQQQEDGHGLASQETRCREYAAAKGYEVEAVFPDTITGGGDFMRRPGMVALLSYLDAQPDQRFVVIFDDLKRFARDTRFHLDLRDAFRARRAHIECLNFKLDESPEGEFIETIMAAQGALERKQNGRQVAQKMKARMQNGYWVHNAPIGYRYETQPGQGKLLVHHEPLASIVRDAFEGYASGRFGSQAEIRRYFDAEPSFPRNRNGEITQQRVTDILTQPLYTGHICSETYGLHWLEGRHEPLISIDTFDKVQARRGGAAKAPTRKDISADFPLRGFIACADCGHPYTACWSTGKRKKYPYYLCDHKGCPSYRKSVPRGKLEGDVAALVRALQPTKGLIALATDMFKRAWDARTEQARVAIDESKREAARLEKQAAALIDRLVDATDATIIQAYERKLATIERDKARAAETARTLSPAQCAFAENLEHALTFLANPWKLWENGSMTAKRCVLKLAFADRIPYCRMTGPRTPETTLPFKVLRGIEPGESGLVRVVGLEPTRP